uniref:Uncharacterized protein n=1 Tax=Parascaris univalens TaxID=6257 RepID=A0A915AUV1_PARUN
MKYRKKCDHESIKSSWRLIEAFLKHSIIVVRDAIDLNETELS